jgi:copper homeostasis protein
MLEICCFDIASCVLAEKSGADRIELCMNKLEGGITPSLGLAKKAIEACQIPIFLMLRPRGGDFHYSHIEKEIMLADLKHFMNLKPAGIVVGALLPNGDLDLPFLKEIKDITNGIHLTFHRAFDRCKDPFQALQQLIELGYHTILTSGQTPIATEGKNLLKTLQERANSKIEILVGSGVLPENIRDFAKIGIKSFHFSAHKTAVSSMNYRNTNFSDQDGTYPSVNIELIKEAKAIIEKL